MNRDPFAFLETSESCTTIDELIACFSTFITLYGYRYFVLTRIPAVNVGVASVIACTTYPEQWARLYQERGYHLIDPISQVAATASKPFTWAEALAQVRITPQMIKMMDDAAAFGLVEGFVTPMIDPDSFQAVVGLAATQRLVMPAKHRHELALASTFFKIAFDDLQAALKPPARPSLTPREIEILRWSAAGKTAWEIAEILTISERTVQSHLTNAKLKLSANTVTQAVATAIQRRIISP